VFVHDIALYIGDIHVSSRIILSLKENITERVTRYHGRSIPAPVAPPGRHDPFGSEGAPESLPTEVFPALGHRFSTVSPEAADHSATLANRGLTITHSIRRLRWRS